MIAFTKVHLFVSWHDLFLVVSKFNLLNHISTLHVSFTEKELFSKDVLGYDPIHFFLRVAPLAVPDLTKPVSAQSPATQSSSASPSPGPTPSASPSPATLGPGSAASPSQGGNNAKRLAVANGQPTTTISSSTAGGPGAAGSGGSSSGGGAQAPQQQPRYMPREVPPRFRCQQDHKVLLKRGQPPLSSMLLGGGGAGDGSNANMAAVSGELERCGSSHFKTNIQCKEHLFNMSV